MCSQAPLSDWSVLLVVPLPCATNIGKTLFKPLVLCTVFMRNFSFPHAWEMFYGKLAGLHINDDEAWGEISLKL